MCKLPNVFLRNVQLNEDVKHSERPSVDFLFLYNRGTGPEEGGDDSSPCGRTVRERKKKNKMAGSLCGGRPVTACVAQVSF